MRGERRGNWPDFVELPFVTALSVGRALCFEKSEPRKSKALFQTAADMSLAGMLSDKCSMSFDLRCDSFKVFYSRAIAGVLDSLRSRGFEASSGFFIAGRSFSLSMPLDPTVEDVRSCITIISSGRAWR